MCCSAPLPLAMAEASNQAVGAGGWDPRVCTKQAGAKACLGNQQWPGQEQGLIMSFTTHP